MTTIYRTVETEVEVELDLGEVLEDVAVKTIVKELDVEEVWEAIKDEVEPEALIAELASQYTAMGSDEAGNVKEELRTQFNLEYDHQFSSAERTLIQTALLHYSNVLRNDALVLWDAEKVASSVESAQGHDAIARALNTRADLAHALVDKFTDKE